MSRLALALPLLLSACGSFRAQATQPDNRRISLPGDLKGELSIHTIAGTGLLVVAHNEIPREPADGVWVADLEREAVEWRTCQPPSHVAGFGAAACVSSDAQRVLIGAVSRLESREPGRVLFYRLPQLDFEREVRSDVLGDGFGTSIAEIADQDGDQRPDFVVGAPWRIDEAHLGGALLLFSGADGRMLRRIDGPALGWGLAGCADADGDGIRDLAVLARGCVELRSGRDLHVLRTLAKHGGMFPVLFAGTGLALLEDDGGSWPYSSHLTLTAWSAGAFEQLCQWKPDRYAHLYRCPGEPAGARLAYPRGGRLVSSDVCGNDERELAPCGDGHVRALCELPGDGPTRWRTAVVLGLAGGKGDELLLTTR